MPPTPMNTDAPKEAPIISVAELDRRLRRAVEATTGNEWIVGEVSSLKAAGSGHLYFTLKDEREDALIECVMYRMQALRYKGLFSDGARVQVAGKATLWAPRGRLQLVVERARPSGRGALLEALEKLKHRLAEEGLFAAARKRALPTEPRLIGVVTSATGAAFWDIVAVAHRRGRARLLLAPAQVQGEGSVDRLIAAMDLIERHPLVDVIIIGRGGGAGEDLMAFNDERLVRRIARARVPTVSAVGHDVDTTLADLVADHRAATPSQAAELVVVDHATRCENLQRVSVGLVRAMRRRIEEDRALVEALRMKLKDPRFLLLVRQQQLDEFTSVLERSILHRLRSYRPLLERLSRRLAVRDPRLVLGQSRMRMHELERRLVQCVRTRLQYERGRWMQSNGTLEALSPLTVLGRGYAIATRLDGRVIRGPADVAGRERFLLRLAQGEITAIPAEKSHPDPNAVDEGAWGIDHEQ
ncbi:MAG TPA: exodeoxyribonuclease VII large subunit [Polyangiaceae bacterium]